MRLSPQTYVRLRPYVSKALNLQGGDREAYLAKLAREHPQEIHEVRWLITESENTGSFLQDHPLQNEISETPAHVLESGQVLGDRFEVREFLGQGGMAEVYRVWDRDAQAEVALKTLRRSLAIQPALVNRLKKEARLAQRISHPNICQLFDVVELPGPPAPVVCLVLEFLPGMTLSQKLSEGPLPFETARRIVGQLISGLSAAHQASVIHRDFKSGNIMLIEEPAGLRAVITDFGLAREIAQEGDSTATTSMFGTGAIVGTFSYMAPEQMRGESPTLSVDIHALGVVMFEMVTGELPFPGQTALAKALHRMQTQAKSPRSLVPTLPRAWDDAILACLQDTPDRRPQSVTEVLEILNGSRKWSRPLDRRWWLAGAAATAASAAGLWLWRQRPIPIDPEAERSFKRGEEFSRRRTRDDLRNAIDEFERAVARQPNYEAAWSGLADAYASAANFGFLEPVAALIKAKQAAVEAQRLNPNSAKATGAVAYITSLNWHEWRTAMPAFQKAYSLDSREESVCSWYGAYLGKLGRFDEAIRVLRGGLEQHPVSFRLNQQLAVIYLWARRKQDCLAQARELVRLQPLETSSHIMLGRAWDALGNPTEALASCDAATRLRETAAVRCLRASVLFSLGREREARLIASDVERDARINPLETMQLVLLYARLGEKQKSLDTLEDGLRKMDSTVLTATVHPDLDTLRGEPRFQDFLKRIQFP